MAEYVIKGLVTTTASTGLYIAGVRAVQGSTTKDKALYNSKLGTPVMSDLTIESFSYTDAQGVTQFVPRIQLYSVLLSVNGTKNIVKTAVQGLKGTIKEYISDGDDQIVIEGEITGTNGSYPIQEVADLKALISAPVAFKVVSRFLQNLDIDTLVIEDYDLSQEEGGYSYQKFKLYCCTDIPVELNIISETNTTAP